MFGGLEMFWAFGSEEEDVSFGGWVGVAETGGVAEEEVAPMDVIVTSPRTLLESCGTFSHSHPWRHPIISRSSLPEKNRSKKCCY